MTCRDDVLACARRIVEQKGENRFTVKEIVDLMEEDGTEFSGATIRTHITSRMCVNAPQHHAVVYADFERIGRGVYRLL
jgi:hypothetical protein